MVNFSFFLSFFLNRLITRPLKTVAEREPTGEGNLRSSSFLFLRRMNFDPSVVSREKEAHEFLRVEKQQQQLKKKKIK